MKKHIIIVAGGKGLRMGGDIPKQFLPVCGKPVLMRTLEAFHSYDSAIHIILVLPVSQQAYWKELCREYHFELSHDIADGGETRFHSVMNGLAKVAGDGLVGVHDGAPIPYYRFRLSYSTLYKQTYIRSRHGLYIRQDHR